MAGDTPAQKATLARPPGRTRSLEPLHRLRETSMRTLVFEMALLGAAACGGMGLKARLEVKNSPEFQIIRQVERELSKPGADERSVLWGVGTTPERYPGAKSAYRWTLWMSYALLAALPVGLLGTLLFQQGKGWLAGPVLLLAEAGPLVCIVH